MTLSPDHLTHLTQGSGIAPALIQRIGCSTATSASALARLGFKDYQRKAPALVFPVHDVHGTVALHQIRPDQPRVGKGGKTVKYDTPEGKKLVLAVDPDHRPLLTQTAVPLLLIEGLKKKWAIDSRLDPDHPLCTVGILGVYGWMRDHEPLPDWQSLALEGRQVLIVYDNDALTKKGVKDARAALARFLHDSGAVVSHVDFPTRPGAKVGADDFLISGHTLADLLALAQPTFPEPAPLVTCLADYEEEETAWLWWP